MHTHEGYMKFELSEQVRTRADIETIIYALFEHLDKVSARVQLTDDGNPIVRRVEPSFASIIRFDETNITVEPKEGGFLFVADVSCRPSSTFWVILIMCIPTFLAWLVPIFLYNCQKEVVRLAIGDVFKRVTNEFEVIEAPSKVGIDQRS